MDFNRIAVGGGIRGAAETAAHQAGAVGGCRDAVLVEGGRAVGDGRCSPRTGEHVLLGRALGVGIPRLFTAEDADAHAEVDVPAAGGHGAVPEDEIAVGGVFEIQVAVVPAMAERLGDEAVHAGYIDLEDVQIVLFRVNHVCS